MVLLFAIVTSLKYGWLPSAMATMVWASVLCAVIPGRLQQFAEMQFHADLESKQILPAHPATAAGKQGVIGS